MALLNEELSLWEIGFRWAGHDPDRLWLRLPLPTRDTFRTLVDAILHGHLNCESLSLGKYNGDEPIKRNISNHAWFTALGKAGLEDFAFTICAIPGLLGTGSRGQAAMS